jgi:putative hydrolase of HD superfamily
MAKKKIDRIDTILKFLKEIEKLKLIERKVFVSNKSRFENSAEHSWHLAMFVLLFEKDLPKDIDVTKMLKMALIHDLVEIYAGDTFFFDEEHRKSKKEREERAAKRLFSKLPEDLRGDFRKLFIEYEGKETRESKIVSSFDKLQPMLQNIVSGGYSWKLNKLTSDDVDRHKKEHMLHSQITSDIYKELLSEAKKKKLL